MYAVIVNVLCLIYFSFSCTNKGWSKFGFFGFVSINKQLNHTCLYCFTSLLQQVIPGRTWILPNNPKNSYATSCHYFLWLYTNKSRVKDPSISTWELAQMDRHGTGNTSNKSKGSSPVRGNFLCWIYFALIQFWLIWQNDLFMENFKCHDLARRGSHLLLCTDFTLICAVCLVLLHCKCAMKQK